MKNMRDYLLYTTDQKSFLILLIYLPWFEYKLNLTISILRLFA